MEPSQKPIKERYCKVPKYSKIKQYISKIIYKQENPLKLENNFESNKSENLAGICEMLLRDALSTSVAFSTLIRGLKG